MGILMMAFPDGLSEKTSINAGDLILGGERLEKEM